MIFVIKFKQYISTWTSWYVKSAC